MNHIIFPLSPSSDMRVQQVLELMLQVAEAMQYIGETANLVHRDVAARNVLLVSDTFAKISNFQMAKVMEDNEYNVSD